MRAEDDERAREVAYSTSMQSDLRALTGLDGKPLWDGTSEIQVLRASAEHQAEWQRSRDQASPDGHDEDPPLHGALQTLIGLHPGDGGGQSMSV